MKSTRFGRYIVWLVLAVIFSIGLLLRLQTIMYTEVDRPIRADAVDYIAYAYNLKYFHVYSKSLPNTVGDPVPDALRSPGYPVFISLFLDTAVSSRALLKVQYSQALLSAIVILLAFSLFSVVLGHRLALAVALLTAISPHLVTINVYFLTESLFGFLLMLFFWLLSRLHSPPQPALLLVLGLLLAGASLTRPWLQYFIIILVPLLATRKSALLVFLSFVAVMSIWLLRNFMTIGSMTDGSLMATSILHGAYPDFMYQNNPASYGMPYRFDPRANEITGSLTQVLLEIADRFRNMPYEYIYWYVIGKPISLFSWNIVQGMGDVFIYPVIRSPYFELTHFKFSHDFMRIIHAPLIILAIFGSVVIWVQERMIILDKQALFVARSISLLIGFFIIVHIVAAPFPRYTIPILPLIYGMAIYGVAQLYSWLKGMYE